MLLKADVKILSFTVSRVMGRKLPGLLVLLMALVGGITFFFEISVIIAVKYESWWITIECFLSWWKRYYPRWNSTLFSQVDTLKRLL